MSTYTVRPTTLITNGGGLLATGGSPTNTALANLGDNSDTSYVQHNTTSAVWWTFGLGSTTVATDEYVCRVAGFLRWKDGTAGGSNYGVLYIGVNPYRSTDPKPSYANTIATDGRSTFITQEAGYATVAWSRTDVASLRTLFYDSRSSSLQTQATIAEIGANIYTIKQATATPTATTMTTSTYATIPVQTTATIDWEASTYDWQNLRTVTIQVDVESGGTGIGTGTLVARKYLDTIWTASGTNVTYNVTLSDALGNGTYKIYARAIRHRENEGTYPDPWTKTSVPAPADQYGAWSSAATLTMNVSPPAAPSVAVTADQVNDRQTVGVTLGAKGTWDTAVTIDVQRSTDQATWTAVRGATGLSATWSATTTVYDYEAPRGVAVYYRARTNATSASNTYTSAWSTAANATIAAADWNLKCPENVALNILNLQVTGNPTENMTEELGVFRALDRRYPVVVSGVLGGWDGELNIITSTDAAWTALKAILEAQKVLLLESPFGWSKYIRVIDGAKTTIQGTATTPRRTVTLSYVQTDVP